MTKHKNLSLNGKNIETLEQLKNNLTPALFDAFRSGNLIEWLHIHKFTAQEKAVETLFLGNVKREAQLLDMLYQLFRENEKVKQESKPSSNNENKNANVGVVDGKCVLQFIARDDGTAIDSTTGLLWCRYLIGQEWGKRRAYGDPKEISFSDAMKAIEEFNNAKLGGFSDWRLPHLEELKRIVGSDKMILGNDNSLLGINEVILFEFTKERLWTSSSDTENFSIASMVNYYGGKNARNEISLKYARLVRG